MWRRWHLTKGIRTISLPDKIPSAHFCIGGHNHFRVFCNEDIIPPALVLQGGQNPFLTYILDKIWQKPLFCLWVQPKLRLARASSQSDQGLQFLHGECLYWYNFQGQLIQNIYIYLSKETKKKKKKKKKKTKRKKRKTKQKPTKKGMF